MIFDWFRKTPPPIPKEEETIISITPTLSTIPVYPKPKIEHLGETDLYITLPNIDKESQQVGNVYRKYNPDSNETIEIFCMFYPYRIIYATDIYDDCKKLEIISTIKVPKNDENVPIK